MAMGSGKFRIGGNGEDRKNGYWFVPLGAKYYGDGMWGQEFPIFEEATYHFWEKVKENDAPRRDLAIKGKDFDIDKAVNWLNNNAFESWKDANGKCAKYVRLALEAGGLNTTGRPVPAWQYSAFLPKLGFTAVNTTNYLKGDIAVIKGYPGGTADPKTGIPYGHIQMFNGKRWISDFKQDRPFWPSGKYQTNQPAFQIFRW